MVGRDTGKQIVQRNRNLLAPIVIKKAINELIAMYLFISSPVNFRNLPIWIKFNARNVMRWVIMLGIVLTRNVAIVANQAIILASVLYLAQRLFSD